VKSERAAGGAAQNDEEAARGARARITSQPIDRAIAPPLFYGAAATVTFAVFSPTLPCRRLSAG